MARDCGDPQEIFKKHAKQLRGILGQLEETKEEKVHWQVYVEFKSRVYGTGVNKIFKSGAWHRELAQGTAQHSRTYCSKSKSKVGDYFELGDFAKQGKSCALAEVETLVKDGGTERELWGSHYVCMIRHYKAVCRSILVLNTPIDTAEYEQAKFPWSDEHKLEWDKTIILWGETGIGKTQWALSFFKKPLLVREKDQLGLFDHTYDGIVFDDFNCTGTEGGRGAWSREAQIHLVDQANNSAIKIRYENAVIPAHTKKIFTTNVAGGYVVDLDDPAIKRRCQVIELKKFTF